jgi:hypothetical protein
MSEHTDKDIKGERGGDTGPTKQIGKGQKAEKGDARRENPPHSGPTRPGGSSRGKPGSDSNKEHKES